MGRAILITATDTGAGKTYVSCLLGEAVRRGGGGRAQAERGVILRPLGDVIVLMPPFSSSESEIEFLVRSAAWAIEAVLGGGHS